MNGLSCRLRHRLFLRGEIIYPFIHELCIVSQVLHENASSFNVSWRCNVRVWCIKVVIQICIKQGIPIRRRRAAVFHVRRAHEKLELFFLKLSDSFILVHFLLDSSGTDLFYIHALSVCQSQHIIGNVDRTVSPKFIDNPQLMFRRQVLPCRRRLAGLNTKISLAKTSVTQYLSSRRSLRGSFMPMA
ncbi:hypothetical protein L228DRAFT_117233 [Xylona heveae TC161]|uniref:Uncharacterized protein n=1 Tax=Xylona heveae (strain CBS 132557 / TC161) TaxID=1328760 RepID=A0A165HGJ3_XYLHT|nr:hypothetical protein L228DRAFT_117233 [Xylona heveae TC161]KZF23480.1 hypothetical protein L228DRAFT_117233 [Xylona heveae TC161]